MKAAFLPVHWDALLDIEDIRIGGSLLLLGGHASGVRVCIN
jgi:hypothetical protein